jgi:hypothetical protein
VPLTLAPGDRLTVTNLTAVTDDCARDHACATATTDTNGNVRVGVTATGPILAVQGSTVTVLQRGDALLVSVLRTTGNEPQNINTFGFDTSFYGVTYHAGDPLTAPAPGWGYERNTPEFRRFVHLSQAILEPGDPIAYAPHWFSNLLPVRNGVPAPALVVGTVGDTSVPVSTAIAMARAAGLVDETTDQVLINAGVVEGVANLRTLVDPTNYSQGTDGFNAPRLDPPLRDQLTRNVTLSDGSTATSALLLPYMNPNGQHGFHNPQPDKPFDMDQFLANLIGRWFETRGRELHFDVCQAHEPPDCPWIPSPPP